jgi:threonine dehydrogenase-like Zn-dependent dehydrogenase
MPAPRGEENDTGLARALWHVAPGTCEIRTQKLPAAGPGDVLVRTLFSGISRGTERLVHQGRVPPGEYERMRGPNMGGSFPFPVKYGYCAVGIVEDGPPELIGRRVFALHPHQDRFVLPARAVTPLPDDLPPRRATLAANMETALNALWDSGAGPGDRIAVVGGGIVGLLVAHLAARLPGARVTLVDPASDRAPFADLFGCAFAMPDAAPPDCDIVFHASASAAGLTTAIACAGHEARIVELSWYGEGTVAAPLGGAFHSRRLTLTASQVGQISPSRRPRWNYARRMAAALELLADPRLDALVSQELAFADLPRDLPAILTASTGLAPVIRYD